MTEDEARQARVLSQALVIDRQKAESQERARNVSAFIGAVVMVPAFLIAWNQGWGYGSFAVAFGAGLLVTVVILAAMQSRLTT